nr:MAG TPA: hypothetical protein [Caudoviricetes sp.]
MLLLKAKTSKRQATALYPASGQNFKILVNFLNSFTYFF